MKTHTKKLLPFFAFFLGLAFQSSSIANTKNLTEMGQYRVNLSDPTDTLSCREHADVQAEKLTEYPNGHLIKVADIVVTDNKPWFKTPDNCFIRAHASYLNPVSLNKTTAKPRKSPREDNTQEDSFSQSPVIAALSELTPFEGLTQQITLNFESAESPDKAVVMITENGYLDDSVSGGRYTFQLIKDENGNWRVVGKTHLVKCHQGRGHTNFSEEPCL